MTVYPETRFVLVVNRPGYLPDTTDDPTAYDSLDEARGALVDEIEASVEAHGEAYTSSEFERIVWTARTTLEVGEPIHIAGYAHTIEVA